MAQEQPSRSGDDPATEVIPSLRSGEGIADTRELPVVPSEPQPARQRRPAALLALLAVVALAAVVTAAALWTRSGPGTPATATAGPTAQQSPTAKLTAEISSFDPSGGSGFRPEGPATWRTQTYRSADFGNLKPGVGLLVDLGTAKAVGAVTFDVQGGPLAVELRAADERGAAATDFERLVAETGASGATRLEVKPAKHRYWLLWVTRLAAQNDGGYRAVLRDVAVTGAAG